MRLGALVCGATPCRRRRLAFDLLAQKRRGQLHDLKQINFAVPIKCHATNGVIPTRQVPLGDVPGGGRSRDDLDSSQLWVATIAGDHVFERMRHVVDEREV
jgi:hypothetical protein